MLQVLLSMSHEQHSAERKIIRKCKAQCHSKYIEIEHIISHVTGKENRIELKGTNKNHKRNKVLVQT